MARVDIHTQFRHSNHPGPPPRTCPSKTAAAAAVAAVHDGPSICSCRLLKNIIQVVVPKSLPDQLIWLYDMLSNSRHLKSTHLGLVGQQLPIQLMPGQHSSKNHIVFHYIALSLSLSWLLNVRSFYPCITIMPQKKQTNKPFLFLWYSTNKLLL